jgi:hypothetical protein
MLKIEYVILLTDGQIEWYVEPGYEVKGIGRGRIHCIENASTKQQKMRQTGAPFFQSSIRNIRLATIGNARRPICRIRAFPHHNTALKKPRLTLEYAVRATVTEILEHQ